MKRLIPTAICIAIAITALIPTETMAQRRRVVVRTRVGVRRPIVRSRLVLYPGHPIRRVLPAEIVLRPAHRAVVVGRPLVFLPALAWAPTIASLPAQDRLVWQDSETIDKDEGWVDTNFGIDGSGNALFLDIDGKAHLNFAEITFANGNVQVVDFNEKKHESGLYRLLDFADGRHVKTVRILAKSDSDDTKLVVYLSK